MIGGRHPGAGQRLALTRASVVTPIASLLARIGAPVEGLLVEAGLPARILADGEALIPTVSMIRFLNRAARSQGIDNLGLLAGLEARVEAFGVLGRLIGAAPTLGAALQAGVRHQRTFSSDGRTWVAGRGE